MGIQPPKLTTMIRSGDSRNVPPSAFDVGPQRPIPLNFDSVPMCCAGVRGDHCCREVGASSLFNTVDGEHKSINICVTWILSTCLLLAVGTASLNLRRDHYGFFC